MKHFSLLLLIGCASTTKPPTDSGPPMTTQTTGTETTTTTTTTTSNATTTTTTTSVVYPVITGGTSSSAQYVFAYQGLDDADADGDWEVGESAVLRLQITNTGVDDMAYPNCAFRSADDITSPSDNTAFGIIGGTTWDCAYTLVQGATIAADDVVNLEVFATRLNCTSDCPEENPISMQFQIVAPN